MQTTKRYMAATAAFMLLTLLALAGNEVKITILHTNDTHSRIEPFDKSDPKWGGLGGVLRREAYISQVRAEEKNVLLIDCGDFSQGTHYYNVFRGDAEIDFMNEMGYAVGTFGNHEFDFGLDNLARLARKARFPFVCANYDFSDTPLKGLTRPYTIVEMKGVRIGIVGVGADPHGLVQAANYEGMRFAEPYGTADSIAVLLKTKKRCDYVVCVSHLGLACEGTNRYCDHELAKRSTAIDIVIGGHSHTYMEHPESVGNAKGKPISIIQMGKNGVYVGRIDLTFEKED